MDVDERIFEGLDLEEPSERADAAIAAMARDGLAGGRTRAVRRGWDLAAHGALAACIVMALFILLPADREPAGTVRAPLPGVAAAPAAAAGPSLRDLEELRSDLAEIGEMAELIPQDQVAAREEISSRLRGCLDDLDRLALELGGFDQSYRPEPERKEMRI